MLAGLRHLAVAGGNDDDGAVHAGGTGDHVLDVVGVAGAVDVGIVAVLGLVLDVGSGDGDAALTLLGCLVDGTVLKEVGQALFRLPLGDGGGKGGFAVVDMADCALGDGCQWLVGVQLDGFGGVHTDVYVRLVTLENGGVASARGDILSCALGAESELDGVY